MELLIKNATILCSSSPYHGRKADLWIVDGEIRKIGDCNNQTADRTVEENNTYVTIGLCDIGTQGGEPGLEHRETMDSLTMAALAGGYTEIVLMPNLKPVTQHKAQVDFLTRHTNRNGVIVRSTAALSVDCKGVDITEMMDLHHHGVVGFTDGLLPVQDSGLLSRALHYASGIDASILHHPNNKTLAVGGEMHEGTMSTSLGLKGVPDIAEIQMVERDILIAGHFCSANGKNKAALIEHAISAAGSVTALGSAKEKGINIGATVSYLNLLFTDQDLADFDTNLKVNPVLRSHIDQAALQSGVISGTIDAIVSNHVPLDEEVKNLEFPYASPGATGLETCFVACLDQLTKVIELETLVDAMTIKPRHLLGLPVPEIREGAEANLCVFTTDAPWTYTQQTQSSLSINNPWLGHTFRARVLATITGQTH
jgi:dihydroorotase